MRLPLTVDLTPTGEIVERADYDEPGYMENVEYMLQLHPYSDGIEIIYYGEDDEYLDDELVKQIVKKALNEL